MKKYILILIASTCLFLNSAWAADLNSAKNSGQVGETPSGYLQTVGGQSDEIKNLVKSVNAKRKEKYKKIAQSRGTSLQAVEKVAGQTAIDKTKSGNYVKVNGEWKKKQ